MLEHILVGHMASTEATCSTTSTRTSRTLPARAAEGVDDGHCFLVFSSLLVVQYSQMRFPSSCISFP